MNEPLRRLLRPMVHAARSLRDRALHPLRRRKARQLVRGIPRVRAVLFMCTGNICRSPYAEKAWQRVVDGPRGESAAIRATSGGFLASGRPSPDAALRLAAERGIVLEGHTSRTFEPGLLEGIDLIVVMEAAHRRGLRAVAGGSPTPIVLLGDLDPEPPSRREIRDPWGQADEVFRESFARIDRCLEALRREVRATHAGNGPEPTRAGPR